MFMFSDPRVGVTMDCPDEELAQELFGHMQDIVEQRNQLWQKSRFHPGDRICYDVSNPELLKHFLLSNDGNDVKASFEYRNLVGREFIVFNIEKLTYYDGREVICYSCEYPEASATCLECIPEFLAILA